MKQLPLDCKILGLWILALVPFISLCIFMCDGHLIYTLDDPYIHLSLAYRILHGGYGVNAGEMSAPSSSILWPLMLAPMILTGFKMSAPLLLDLLATGLTIIVGVRLLQREGLLQLNAHPLFRASVVAVFVLAISPFALPITGMEHNWHVLATVCAFSGLLLAAQGATPSFCLLAAIVAMPLFRFEGMAYASLCLLALWLYGYRRQAVVTAIVLLILLGGYVVFMVSHDLPVIPSSVLLKSRVMSTAYGQHGSELGALWGSLKYNLSGSAGRWQLAAILAMGGITYACRSGERRMTIFNLTVFLALLAHLLCGQYGWFYRYEIYVNTLAVLGLLAGVRQLLPRLDDKGQRILPWVALFFCFGMTAECAVAAWVAPSGSRNIYEQQVQMRRFVQDYYQRPVGVNDLGLVSYGNSQYTLDLWGLGSEPVRKLILQKAFTPEAMDKMVRDRDVGLVIIYQNWFKALPENWQKVAILHTSKVTAAEGEVTFYVTISDARDYALQQLKEWQPTLPAQDRLELFEP